MNSEIVQAFNVPYVIVLATQTYEFPRLSPPEVAGLAARIKARNVAAVKSLCEECNVVGVEKLKVVKQAQDEEATINSVWKHAMSIDGAREIIVMSLKKAGKSDEEIAQTIHEIGPELTTQAAIIVTGFVANDQLPPEKKPDDAEKKAAAAAKKDEPIGFGMMP